MARTLAQIISDARQIFGQTDSANSSVSDAQLTIWANDAYRKVATALEVIPIKTRDYTIAVGDITLNALAVSVDSARYEDENGDFQVLTVVGLNELIKMDPNFEGADTGNPQYLARTGTFAVRLYTNPKTELVGETLRLSGLEMPTELSASTDIPDLPGNMQDILSSYVAHRALQFLERGDESVAQLTLFRGAVKDMKGISANFSRGRHEMRWEPGEVDDG